MSRRVRRVRIRRVESNGGGNLLAFKLTWKWKTTVCRRTCLPKGHAVPSTFMLVPGSVPLLSLLSVGQLGMNGFIIQLHVGGAIHGGRDRGARPSHLLTCNAVQKPSPTPWHRWMIDLEYAQHPTSPTGSPQVSPTTAVFCYRLHKPPPASASTKMDHCNSSPFGLCFKVQAFLLKVFCVGG